MVSNYYFMTIETTGLMSLERFVGILKYEALSSTLDELFASESEAPAAKQEL